MEWMPIQLQGQTKKSIKLGVFPPVDRLPQEYIIILTNI
jgi:hypothetical protein